MDVDQLPAEPLARCKVCGDADVVVVCHHCSATLCQTHGTNGAPGSREFRRLDIRKKGLGEDPNHCADCSHRLVSNGEVLLLLLLSAGFAFLVMSSSSSTAVHLIALLLIIVVAGALAFVHLRQRGDEVLDHCPVIPEVENERIVETYRYRSTLSDDGTWQHRTIGADGVAKADLRFGPDDVKRVATFPTASGRIDEVATVEAGFVVLKLKDETAAVDGINIVDGGDRFGAERITLEVDRLPYLLSDVTDPGRASEPNGRRSSSVHHWTKDLRLRLPDGPRLPVHVYPTLAPGADRRTLEFHIHWRDTTTPMDLIADRVVHGIGDHRPTYIDFLEFRLPLVGLGELTPIDGDPIVTDELDESGGGYRRVRWEQVSIGRGESSKRLSVRFEQPISPNIHIDGSLAVVFESSLAGLEGMSWFDPMGRPHFVANGDAERSSPTTTASVVDIAFEFSTAKLPYEASLVRMEKPIGISSSVLASIRPDHKTAIELSHRLTEAGFSIFQVSESTFSPSDRSAEENRVWELRGRYFENTAPLDFQVKIGGADLRRRLEGSAETYQVTGVTLAGQAGVDDPETLSEFQAQLRTIEEQAEAALVRLAGQGPSVELAPGHEHSRADQQFGLEADDVASQTASSLGSIPSWNRSEPPRDYDVADYRQERRCSMCGRGGDDEEYSLCHHCGRMVCQKRCSVRVRRDRAFARGADKQDISANHCEGCAEQAHTLSLHLHRLRRSRALARFFAQDA